MKWLKQAIRNEQRAMERARGRFIRKPTEKRLHEVRTTGRRFRSLLEDVADLTPVPRLLRRVKRAADATDAARDAAIILRLLKCSVDPAEGEIARSLLDQLRVREELALRVARRRLRGVRFLQ